MAEVFLPPGVRYECVQCGECCRALEVWLTDAEAERVRGAQWPPEIGPPANLTRKLRGKGPHRWRLRPLPDGACRFLTTDNLCVVHQRLGYAAKPFAGRLFPFSFVLTPIGTFVGVRFECPSVVRGVGRPLDELRPHIRRLLDEYVRTYSPAREGPRVRFFGRYELSWRDILRLEDQLLAFLNDRNLSVREGLLAGLRLVRRFASEAIRGGEGRRIGVDPGEALAHAQAGEPTATERVLARLLAASYAGATPHAYREWPFLQRMGWRLRGPARRLAIAVGLGAVSLPRLGRRVLLKEIREVAVGKMEPDSEAMLRRYYVAKVASQGFFGLGCFGRSFAEGFDALATSYWVVMWLARASALAHGRIKPKADDLEYAIRTLDHSYNHLPEFRGARERVRSALFWNWRTSEKLLSEGD